MATLYWYGDSGNWSDYTNHWSYNSGNSPSAPASAVPTSSDDIRFDRNSFSSSGQVVTIDATAYCKDMDWTGALYNPTLNIGIYQLRPYGNITFISNMTFTGNGQLRPYGNTTQTLTSNGLVWSTNLIQDQVNSILSLADNLALTSIDIRAGTFITNNHTVTANGFYKSTDGIATITLGSSIINCTGWAGWNYSGSNLTLHEGTSTINSGNFTGGSETYYIVNLTGNSTVSGDNTFAKLGISNSKTITITAGTTQTFADCAIGSGVTLKSSSTGNTYTLAYTGAVAPSTATGGGLTMTDAIVTATNAPANKRYWVQGTGNWSDDNNHWSALSGFLPAGATNWVPTSSDDVYFNANAFYAAGQVVTVDTTAYHKDMDWTGATNNPTMAIGALHISAYGNVTFTSDMTINATSWGWYLDLLGNTTQELTTAGITNKRFLIQFNTASNLSLQDDLTCGQITMARGVLTTNNHNITAVSTNADWGIQIKGTTAKTMNLGSSVITTSEWDYEASGLTLNEGTSTINCSTNFAGNGETYNIVNLTGATSTVTGSNTFAQLNLDDTKTQTITFTDGTTQTAASFSLSGSAGHVHTLKGSSTGGWALSRNYGGGFWGDYLAISNSNVSATDGSTKRWNYGPNSTASSSTGWTSRTADDMAIFNSNLKDKDLFSLTSITRSIQTVLLDALIKATDSKTVSIDTLIKGVDITSTITIDTLIKDTDLKTVLLDTLIKGQSASTVSLDTQIRDTDSTSVSLDTLIKDTALQTISISALIGNRIDFIPKATNSSSQTHKATNSSTQTNKATNSEF